MNAENTQQAPVRPVRHRSRAYPVIALPDAIEKAKEIRVNDSFNWIPAAVATGHWGLKPTSGFAQRVIAALIQYGLLAEKGSKTSRTVQLTELAKFILNHPDVVEQNKAVKEAALMPKIYSEIWEQYNGELPSDSTLKWNLTAGNKLNEKVVDGFIRDFRATIEFAELEKYQEIEENNEEETMENTNEQNAISSSTDSTPEKSTKPINQNETRQQGEFELPIYLSEGRATLRMPSPLSSRDFEKIKAVLGTTLDVLRHALVLEDASIESDDGG